MRGDSNWFRTLAGAAAVLALSGLAAAAWHGLLGHGLPLRGQWDPLAGPVGPRPLESSEGLVTLQQAYEKYRDGMSRFLDARSPEDFEEGHIEGAINVPALFDEEPAYRPLFEAFAKEIRPDYEIPLVTYCNGADCDDSRMLQGKLFDRGYFPVEIFFAGFPAWKKAGYPVVLGASRGAGAGGEKPLYPAAPLRVPMLTGMILMGAFLVGRSFRIGFVRSLWDRPWLAVLFRLILGAVFLYAAFYKITDPGSFAKAIYNYRILPGGIINLFAMVLPWIEAVAGLLLVIGAFTRGAGLVLGLLLVVFLAAVGFNVARGHSFDCGCFQKAQSDHVSDPVELLFRDVLLAVMALEVVTLGGAHVGAARWLAGGSRGTPR